MCGIIGYIGLNDSKNILIDCLKKLEYRGYDSSGVTFVHNNSYTTIKCAGKINNLEEKLATIKTAKSTLGIGHTRWATHGVANDTNAHPHEGKTCILVHNGIIENYQTIKNELINSNHNFYSNVDSEVIAKLIDEYSSVCKLEILKKVCNKLKGSYALAIIFKDELNKLYFAKKDSPLIIGIQNKEKYISSDINSITDYCKRFIYVPENSYGVIGNDINIHDFKGNKIAYDIETLDLIDDKVSKNKYPHFMLKEIEETPTILEKILNNNLENSLLKINLEEYKGINKIVIIGCGSAMHAGLIGKYYLEKFANINVEVEVASEYRYKDLVLNKKTLAIFISQSGETADTLACLKLLKSKKIKTLSFVNAYNSSIAKLSDKVIYTTCGKEIAIASTKAVQAQIMFLTLFSIKLAHCRKKISYKKVKQYTSNLYKIPQILRSVLAYKNYKAIAKLINKNKKIIFIGRSIDYYLGLEASLKLKEITYIPCMCYQSGELKHGPISLVDNKTLVFVINTNEHTLEKTLSNAEEIKARSGNTYSVSTSQIADHIVNDEPFANVFYCTAFFQLVAYHTALLKKLDIDKPRNLAKSVTVE